MCNIGKFFSRTFTLPGTGGAEAALEQQKTNDALLAKQAADAQAQTNTLMQQQADTAAKALQLQQEAIDKATAASVPVADSESARRAAEDRQRRLVASSSFAFTAGKQFLGEPPIGYKMLMGR